jgi:hypothetical protein
VQLRVKHRLRPLDLTLGSSSHLTETDLQASVAKLDYFGGNRPTFGRLLTMNVPIFDGFARRPKKSLRK